MGMKISAISKSYAWWSIGDVNSAATIVFDTLTNMAMIAFLLTTIFGMPSMMVIKHIIPGLSLGIVFSNLAYIYLAFRLAKRTGKTKITALPSGLDSPSCIGLVLAVTGPVYLMAKHQGFNSEQAALYSWYVSCSCTFFIGVVKLVLAFWAHKIKRLLPTVALLGGLSGVAIALITFFPLLLMFELPVASFAVWAIILGVYFGGYRLPGNLPAIVVAIVVGTLIYYLFQPLLTSSNHFPSSAAIKVTLPLFSLEFFHAFWPATKFFPVAFPFALLVIFGTVSVAESAEVLGEKYSSRDLLVVDGIATLLMSVFGGTAQTTVYAGFPAYKKMGARAGYLIVNIVLVGLGAWFGLINYLIALVPDAILAPVLMFVGIEIAMQVFLVCEKKHFPAAIIGLFPSIARLLEITLVSNTTVVSSSKLHDLLYTIVDGRLSNIAAIVIFGNGFIVTGTLWAAIVYYLIEHKLIAVLTICGLMAIASLFGVIHSINLDGSMYWWPSLPKVQQIMPVEIALSYLMFAFLVLVMHLLNRQKQLAKVHA